MGKKQLQIPSDDQTKDRLLCAVGSLGQQGNAGKNEIKTQNFENLVLLSKSGYRDKFLVLTGELQVYSILISNAAKYPLTKDLDAVKESGDFDKEVSKLMSNEIYTSTYSKVTDRLRAAQEFVTEKYINQRITALIPEITKNECKKLNEDWLIDFHDWYTTQNPTTATTSTPIADREEKLKAVVNLLQSTLGYTLRHWPEAAAEIQDYELKLEGDENYKNAFERSVTTKTQLINKQMSRQTTMGSTISAAHIARLTRRYIMEEDAASLRWITEAKKTHESVDFYYVQPITPQINDDIFRRYEHITRLAEGQTRKLFLSYVDVPLEETHSKVSQAKPPGSSANLSASSPIAQPTPNLQTQARAHTIPGASKPPKSGTASSGGMFGARRSSAAAPDGAPTLTRSDSLTSIAEAVTTSMLNYMRVMPDEDREKFDAPMHTAQFFSNFLELRKQHMGDSASNSDASSIGSIDSANGDMGGSQQPKVAPPQAQL